MKSIKIGLGALILGLSAVGCDEIDNTIDCAQVCSAYADCFDSSFDVDRCTDRCEDEADRDEDFEDALESCESCIEGQSCGEATFMCGADCVGIIIP